MTPTEMIEVIKAYEEGNEIEMADKNKNDWKLIKVPLWNFAQLDYRVKPKEKFVYQYMYKNQSTNKYYITNEFYTDAFAASNQGIIMFYILRRRGLVSVPPKQLKNSHNMKLLLSEMTNSQNLHDDDVFYVGDVHPL
jgi:hypothetical protein